MAPNLYKDGPSAAVRVYTVCDESKYLIVRNVPALGCGDQLADLFRTYGDIEDCKPMDAEDCEPFTDVFWIKFVQVSSARFAKRKLDESVFFGNKLEVSYAPDFETLTDTMEKLEGRRKEVLGRIKHGRAEVSKKMPDIHRHFHTTNTSQFHNFHYSEYVQPDHSSNIVSHVSSNKEYFPSSSMNQTVQLVRDKLDKINSSADNLQAIPTSKNARLDKRRRI